MIIPETLKLLWWKWWSNPLIHIHPNHRDRIPFNIGKDSEKPLEYYQLLQIRSLLELEDLPGPTLETQPELVALAAAPVESVEKHLHKLCVLTMDNMVIHLRPQEWESKFGIASAETIREIIEQYRSIPATLSKWQFSTAVNINQNENLVLKAPARTILGLGIILKSFFPQFYKRWVLTTDQQTTKLLNQIDPIEESAWNEIIEWIGADLKALYEETARQYVEPDISMTEDFEDDDYTPLDIDSIYGGANA
jgi:hypothetical protein